MVRAYKALIERQGKESEQQGKDQANKEWQDWFRKARVQTDARKPLPPPPINV